MIVSDTHEFVFVHIPKCGGTALREPLGAYDNTDSFFTSRVAQLGDLGVVDYVHLPLDVLRVEFPDVYSKLDHYKSFALMRDPETRFGSALGQWFKNTRHERILECSPATVVGAARAVLDELERDPSTLRPELIHFRPQADFVKQGGRRIIRRLYRVEDLAILRPTLEQYLGVTLREVTRRNQAMYYRNRFAKTMVGTLRPVLTPVWNALPLSAKKLIHAALLRPPSDTSDPVLFGTDLTVKSALFQAGLREEIRAFYAEDYDLLRQCEQLNGE